MMSAQSTTRAAHAVKRGLRSLLSLAIIVPMLATSAPRALADDGAIEYGPTHKVAARMELDIKNVHVYDDREPFYESGEIRLEARVWKIEPADGCPRWSN